MTEHTHGTMKVDAQEKVFEGFVRWVVGVGAFSIGTLIFLAIFNS